MTLIIPNKIARHLFLERHGLSAPPHASDHDAGGHFGTDELLSVLRHLGFVQLDSINAVERAHHLILFSRAPAYRRELLTQLHHQDAAVFEHWTHDASIMPMEFYPHWQHQFRRARSRIRLPRWQSRLGENGAGVIRNVRARIREEGALMARDFEDKGQGAWWGWGPSKTALEYLWRTGELAIARREGFEKVYDLASRVIPAGILQQKPGLAESQDWFCREALRRLGFASAQEIAAFWNHVPVERTRWWIQRQLKRGHLIQVEVEAADGRLHPAFAPAGLEALLQAGVVTPPGQVRLLSPFDPLIRDRKRALRLFGFDYKLEVFVPEAKRRYGYYVLPLLQGDTFIGRADIKVHRTEGRLEVKGFWPEPSIIIDLPRKIAIDQALQELAVFAGTPEIDASLVFGN